jgi:hypothetical protein
LQDGLDLRSEFRVTFAGIVEINSALRLAQVGDGDEDLLHAGESVGFHKNLP